MGTNYKKSKCISFLMFLFICFGHTLSAQNLSLQLTPSDFNGFNISCFGSQNGAIDLTVTGGTAPFTYQWSNDIQTEDLTNLAAGYYHVIVTDANQVSAEAEITLTEPKPIKIYLTIYKYPNGFNISQNGSCNGNIAASSTGGVSPYSYHWNPGNQTTNNPANLCAGLVSVDVMDNNGCAVKDNTILSQPDKDSWLSSGNANSNPQIQFIGTTDSKDLVFKTDNSERFKIGADGKIKIKGLGGGWSHNYLYVDELGNLFKDGGGGNTFPWCHAPVMPWYSDDADMENIWLCSTRKVGIGTNSPDATLHIKPDIYNGLLISYDHTVFTGTALEVKTLSNNSFFKIAASGETTISGNTGIGTIPSTNLSIKLHTQGFSMLDGPEASMLLGNDNASTPYGEYGIEYYDHVADASLQGLNFWKPFMSTYLGLKNFILYLNNHGNVGIGVDPIHLNDDNYRLSVNGGIRALKVKVYTGWADYVFAKNYHLKSLAEVEKFIGENGHLEGIPTADEIETNGVELGEMQRKIVEKLEETTLYLIELRKEYESLRAEIEKLKRRN